MKNAVPNKKFSVLIDLDKLKDPNTGLGQVAINFGNIISKIDDPQLSFTFLVPKKWVGYFGKNVNYEVVSLRRRFFPQTCYNFDLWYTIHQDNSYFPVNKKTPFILTINDLNFLGEKSPAKAAVRLRRLQKKVDRASVITTISDYTGREVKQNLKTGKIPVQTIYCGVEVKHFENAERPSYVPIGKVLFSVGVVLEKKNYMTLLPFVKELPPEYNLIIAGNRNSNYAIRLEERAKMLDIESRIIIPGIISDEDKSWLYSNCEAVLFPSKFEGMGFPPIEAMRYKKPVFASTFSSIPEVSGENSYYWTDFDPLKMAEFFNKKIKEFHSDPQLGDKVKEFSMKYSWEACAQSYLRLFKEVLGISPDAD